MLRVYKQRLEEIRHDIAVYAEEITLLAREEGKSANDIFLDLNKANMKIKRLLNTMEDKIEFT